MGPIEDFANPSSLDHDAATNYGLLAHAVDDVRVGQHKSVVSHGPHVASRARGGNPSLPARRRQFVLRGRDYDRCGHTTATYITAAILRRASRRRVGQRG